MAEFQPDSSRAQKKFPELRMTRAMAMDRIDYMFKQGGDARKAAIKKFNTMMGQGSQSGGFTPSEERAAKSWYKSKMKPDSKTRMSEVKAKASEAARSRGGSGGGGMNLASRGRSRSMLQVAKDARGPLNE